MDDKPEQEQPDFNVLMGQLIALQRLTVDGIVTGNEAIKRLHFLFPEMSLTMRKRMIDEWVQYQRKTAYRRK